MPLLVSLITGSQRITSDQGIVIGFLKGQDSELELTEEEFISSNDCIDSLSTRLKIEVFPNGRPKKKAEKKVEPKKEAPIVEKKEETVTTQDVLKEDEIKEIVEPEKENEIKEIVEPNKGNSINESGSKKSSSKTGSPKKVTLLSNAVS